MSTIDTMYTIESAVDHYKRNSHYGLYDSRGRKYFRYTLHNGSISLNITLGKDAQMEGSGDDVFELYELVDANRIVFSVELRPTAGKTVFIHHNDMKYADNDGELFDILIKRVTGNKVNSIAISNVGGYHYVYNYAASNVVDVSDTIFRCEPTATHDIIRRNYQPNLELGLWDDSDDYLYTDAVIKRLLNDGIFNYKLLTINDGIGFNYYINRYLKDETTISVFRNTKFDTDSRGYDLFEELATRLYRSRKVQLPERSTVSASDYIWEHKESFPLLYLNLHRNATIRAVRGGEYYKLINYHEFFNRIISCNCECFDSDALDSVKSSRRVSLHLDDCIEI